ncbi:two pore domain potassium channel family protein [bacterium]|nr:two pore domain potassium channel family protein [bacterium]
MTAYKYQALLAALLAVIVAYPALRGPAGSPGLAWAARGAVVVTAVVVVFGDRRLRPWVALLTIPVVVGGGAQLLAPDEPAAAAAGQLAVVAFHFTVLVALLRGIRREQTITTDAVAAALCGYLLLGLAFGHTYGALATAVPGSFAGLDPALGPDDRQLRLTYFSFTTLTTLGYGDITPARDTARALVILEAVTGQCYLAVLVADLVGKRLATATTPTPPAG